VVFSGVNLLLDPAYSRPICPDQDKDVLGVEADLFVIRDDLNMREPLTVRANLVLALHYQDAFWF